MVNMLKEEKKFKIPRQLIGQKLMHSLEGELLKEVKAYIVSLEEPIFFRRVEGSGKVFTTATGKTSMIKSDMTGFPDLLLLIDTVFFAVELKIEGKYVSERQAKTILEIEKAGGNAAVVCSLDGFKRFINLEKQDILIDVGYGKIKIYY